LGKDNGWINTLDNEDRPPLYYACRFGDIKMVKLLLNVNASISLGKLVFEDMITSYECFSYIFKIFIVVSLCYSSPYDLLQLLGYAFNRIMKSKPTQQFAIQFLKEDFLKDIYNLKSNDIELLDSYNESIIDYFIKCGESEEEMKKVKRFTQILEEEYKKEYEEMLKTYNEAFLQILEDTLDEEKKDVNISTMTLVNNYLKNEDINRKLLIHHFMWFSDKSLDYYLERSDWKKEKMDYYFALSDAIYLIADNSKVWDRLL